MPLRIRGGLSNHASRHTPHNEDPIPGVTWHAPAINIVGMNIVLPNGTCRWLHIGIVKTGGSGPKAFKLDTPILTNGYTIAGVKVISVAINVSFRIVDVGNFYSAYIWVTYATEDFRMRKCVNGVETDLAYEAVDLSLGEHVLMCRAIGTTIEGWRGTGAWGDDIARKLSVTDTSHASGYGGGAGSSSIGDSYRWCMVVKESSTPTPINPPIAYFEVPVIGSGTPEDPFRAQMPELIVEDPVLGKRNLLALTNSALIKTGKDGKPTEYTAIVRIFEQPDRDPKLKPISACVEALRSIRGARRLDREEAIRRAKQLDDLLTDADLLPIKDEKKVKEYQDWRLSQFGVEMSKESAKKYVFEDKGW